MPRLTMSQDGRLRMDFRVTVRLSEEDLKEIKAIARAEKVPWRQWLQNAAVDGVYSSVVRYHDAQGERR